MTNNDNELGGLGDTDKIIDMGDLYGNPIDASDNTDTSKDKEEPELDLDDIELSEEEEEMLRKKIEEIRKSDPFIYRWEY